MIKVLEKEIGIGGDYQFNAYFSRNPIHANWHQNKFHVLRNFVEDKIQKRALDIGAGSGLFELLFSKDFSAITALDYNDDSTKFIDNLCEKNHIGNVKTIILDIDGITSMEQTSKFDLVLILDVIEHLDTKTVDGLLTTLHGLLNTGGKVVVSTPNYGGVWNITEWLADLFKLVPRLNGAQHINRFDKKKLAACFEKNGYSLVRSTTINTFSYLVPVKSLSKKLVDVETKMDLPFGNLIVAEFVPQKQ